MSDCEIFENLHISLEN